MTHLRSRSGIWLILILAFALVAAACGGDGVVTDTTAAPTDTTEPVTDTTAPPGTATTQPAGEGELGSVTIAAGEPVKIATIQAISGGVASLGEDQVTAIEIAIEDRDSELLGHPIELQVEDGLCSAEGGTTAAQKIVSDPQVIGIVGTSCSGAGVPASQIASEAGLVMISGSTTSPSLTALPYLSDEPLEASENFSEGFFRTAHNDEFQGAGAARYAIDGAGAQVAVTIHDGDPYTEGLTTQFGQFFQEFGGEIALATAINKGDTDMRPVLTEIAAIGPDLVFFPIFQPEGDFIIQQWQEFPELAEVQPMGADGLLSDTYMVIPETEGMVFSGPKQGEGSEYEDFVGKYEEKAGTPPIQAFHAHAYDAVNMLLDAIEQVAQQDGDTLVIDRAALRQAMYEIDGYQGLTGTLSCNQFGDCAEPAISVYQNADPSQGIVGVIGNVVFTADFADEVDPSKFE